jgi:hypothetical protein
MMLMAGRDGAFAILTTGPGPDMAPIHRRQGGDVAQRGRVLGLERRGGVAGVLAAGTLGVERLGGVRTGLAELIGEQVQGEVVASTRDIFADMKTGMFNSSHPNSAFEMGPPAVGHSHANHICSARRARMAIAGSFSVDTTRIYDPTFTNLREIAASKLSGVSTPFYQLDLHSLSTPTASTSPRIG